ncbi:MAG: rhodanese-like domain-containing protein [Acidobacteria bacterium]|nr:rhodanese-like domain-containing protein [Acidobacteriota bacterium]
MAQAHSPQFLALVEASRKKIKEFSTDDVKKKLDADEKFHLIDVREGEEYARGRLPGAVPLSKGIIERDIEAQAPDFEAPIVLYCGGGFRSALAAENLQKMGYKNVSSMWGGWRVWNEKGFPTEK